MPCFHFYDRHEVHEVTETNCSATPGNAKARGATWSLVAPNGREPGSGAVIIAGNRLPDGKNGVKPGETKNTHGSGYSFSAE